MLLYRSQACNQRLYNTANHLDLPAILWLQKYLKSLDGITLLIVSHDRAFMNELADEIIVMKDQRLVRTEYFSYD
jgi:ATPase subunit of ABC transporter with duplicated ATPase domains